METFNLQKSLQQKYKKSLLSKKEAAQELGISQSSLDRLRKSGEINSKKIGGLICFSISEITSFIEA